MDPAPINDSLGDFRIRAVLGQGGSGIVYDATWGPRRVALKVMHAGYVGTGKERQQFIAEAQRLQQITHPSVVKVLAVGQLPDGRPYLAMERLEGETLAQVLSRSPLSVGEALHLFGELCTAVGALHDQGLIHRDLKPENVFIVDRQHAVLLDFGIAKELSAPASTTTQEGGVRGTPAYMAPERFFGQPASISTDVYELAVTFYAMLSGALPWSNPADPEARLSPRALVDHAHVPEALDVEVRRALSTRAQNRPASALALLNAVRAAAGGDATPTTSPQATARMRSGNTKPPPSAEAPVEAPLVQQTPLAWAPTEAAPATAKRAASRRYALYAIPAGAMAIAVTSIVALRGEAPRQTAEGSAASGSGSAATVAVVADAATVATKHDPNDPWSTPVEGPLPELDLVEMPLTAETYRAEAAAAVARLPPDTRLLMSIQIAEVKNNAHTVKFLDKLGNDPHVALLAGIMPPCIRSMAANAQWLVFGAESLDAANHATLVARGRWTRAGVERCLEGAAEAKKLEDGTTIYKFDSFWVDFIDDHTTYVSNRVDLGAAAVHELVKHGGGPQGHTLQLVSKLPIDRTIAFVDEGRANDDWRMVSLPKGSDIYGWIRVEDEGVSMDLMADTHDERTAKVVVAAARKEAADVFDSSIDALGKLEMVREGSLVRFRGKLTPLMLELLDMALPAL